MCDWKALLVMFTTVACVANADEIRQAIILSKENDSVGGKEVLIRFPSQCNSQSSSNGLSLQIMSNKIDILMEKIERLSIGSNTSSPGEDL